ncbi:MAG: HesA/MoeB/ThiF family protein [Halobacteriota archaeon]
MSLSEYDRVRYRRQIMIPGFGEKAQLRLKRATALIAGLGGLGSPLALYLAAAGVGHLKLVDMDNVELSNLNRQVLHWDEDVGESKVNSATQKVQRINPTTRVEGLNLAIDDKNVFELAENCDVILDATDNFAVRYLLNAAAIGHRVPLIHGAVYGYEGRLASVVPGKTACLECIYPHAPPREAFPVLGTTPGVIALLQATEAIKSLTGAGVVLENEMLIYDGEMMNFDKVRISRDPQCTSCAGIAKR